MHFLLLYRIQGLEKKDRQKDSIMVCRNSGEFFKKSRLNKRKKFMNKKTLVATSIQCCFLKLFHARAVVNPFYSFNFEKNQKIWVHGGKRGSQVSLSSQPFSLEAWGSIHYVTNSPWQRIILLEGPGGEKRLENSMVPSWWPTVLFKLLSPHDFHYEIRNA